MDTPHTTGARGTTSKRKVGRPSKGVYKPYSIKARIDIANELESLASDGTITRTELFEAAAAIALRDKEALLAEVQAQREKAVSLRMADLSSPKGGHDVAA